MTIRIKKSKDYDLAGLKKLLAQTYWANERGDETIRKSVENSLSYFMYDGDELIGFARVITDYATNYYLCDVIIDKLYRGRGLGVMLIENIINDPLITELKGLLVTKDAHELYTKFGFSRREDVFMQKVKNSK